MNHFAPPAPSRPHRLGSTRFGALVVAVLLVAAACTPSGAPEDYDATTEENFIEACEANGAEQATDVAAVCRCSYDRIVAQIPFEDFESFDDELRDDINAQFDDQISAIVADCIRETAS